VPLLEECLPRILDELRGIWGRRHTMLKCLPTCPSSNDLSWNLSIWWKTILKFHPSLVNLCSEVSNVLKGDQKCNSWQWLWREVWGLRGRDMAMMTHRWVPRLPQSWPRFQREHLTPLDTTPLRNNPVLWQLKICQGREDRQTNTATSWCPWRVGVGSRTHHKPWIQVPYIKWRSICIQPMYFFP
jgi:hypothetical protein